MGLKESTLLTLGEGVHVFRRGGQAVQFGIDATRTGIIDTADAEAVSLILRGLDDPTPVAEVRAELAAVRGMDSMSAQSLIDDLYAYRVIVEKQTHQAALLGSSLLAAEIARVLESDRIQVRTPLAGESVPAFLDQLTDDVPLVIADQFSRYSQLNRALSSFHGWRIPVMSFDSRILLGPISIGNDGPCLECIQTRAQARDSFTHTLTASVPGGAQAIDPVVAAAGAAATAMLTRRCAGVPDPPGVIAQRPLPGTAMTIDPFGPVWASHCVEGTHERCPSCR